MFTTITIDFIGLFLLISGFVIGLGAVTVIDFHGLLGRRSAYWTEAATRTHKVTKPLIWLGIFLATIGGSLFLRQEPFAGTARYLAVIACILILNGIFLSFRISPLLLQREKEGHASDLLPGPLQSKIIASFIVSFIGWWGALLILVWYLVHR